MKDNEYNLLMNADTETEVYTQWYYFSVQNVRRETVKFNILNFIKNDSLYNEGMQPLVWSDQAKLWERIGWYRDGFEIRY